MQEKALQTLNMFEQKGQQRRNKTGEGRSGRT